MARKQNRAEKAALKSRGIKPGKVTKTNKWGQASGGYSPFAAPAGRKDITDDVEYEAYDRVKGRWFTHKPKRG
jgi:hypothetical protein